jgi:hypothetical protein
VRSALFCSIRRGGRRTVNREKEGILEPFIDVYYILHTTYYILHTTYYILHTTYYILHTTYYILHTTYYILHTTYYILNTTYYILHTTYYILHTTYYILHTTYYILHTTYYILLLLLQLLLHRFIWVRVVVHAAQARNEYSVVLPKGWLRTKKFIIHERRAIVWSFRYIHPYVPSISFRYIHPYVPSIRRSNEPTLGMDACKTRRGIKLHSRDG